MKASTSEVAARCSVWSNHGGVHLSEEDIEVKRYLIDWHWAATTQAPVQAPAQR